MRNVLRHGNRCTLHNGNGKTLHYGNRKTLHYGNGKTVHNGNGEMMHITPTSCVEKSSNGLCPSDHTSYINIPKLHTSLFVVYLRKRMASGAVHLIGIRPPLGV